MPRINTNRLPYSNDFKPGKNFTNILFKPAKSVQIRELNQLQSILHNQTEQFAEHMFKNGSLISGQAASKMVCEYVTLSESPTVLIQEGYLIYGQTSGIVAKVIISITPVSEDPHTLYIKYMSSGTNGVISRFIPGEQIIIADADDIIIAEVAVSAENSLPAVTGSGDVWIIPDGVYYVFGYFVENKATYAIGEKYTSGVQSYKIGFDVVEDIISVIDDPSLYDNAINAPSYTADGADRHRIRLIPVVRSSKSQDGENFILLANVIRGTASYLKYKTEYSNIMDMLAERTYDESGNYTTKKFTINIHEHLKIGNNNGIFSAEEGGDDSKFVAMVSAGRAYIKGYQVERIAESMVVMDKARDLKIQNGFSAAIGEISYIVITPTNGSAPFPQINRENLFNNIEVGLYEAVTGNQIGSIIPVDIEQISSTTYKLFFTNIKIDSGKKFTDIESVRYTDFTANLVADPVVSFPKIYVSDNKELIWKIAETIESTSNNGVDIKATIRKQVTLLLDGSGTGLFSRELATDTFVPMNKYKVFGGVLSGTNYENVDLSGQGVLFVTPDQIGIDLGVTHANKKIVLFYAVSRIIQTKTKTVETIVLNNQHLNVDKQLVLPHSDIFKLISVIDENTGADITSSFSVFSGQTDYAYVPGILTFSGAWTGHSILVTYKYFQHSTGDCFSVDSYKTAIESGQILSTEIPNYKQYIMRDCIDFRPLALTSDEQTNLEIPVIGGTYSFDLGYYLPRIDLIVINKDGELYQKKGTSSEKPSAPRIAEDGSEMPIYEINQKAYVYNVQKDIQPRFIENKGYTMRDIGRIDQKVSNIEYYTTFTLMEMDIAQTSVKDQFGLDRFKNGFIADNFQNFQAAELGGYEFRAALDRSEKTLRPTYGMYQSGHMFDTVNSTNYKLLGDVALIDYAPEEFMVQPYATKNISVNPYYIFSRTGVLTMNPPFDNWADITQKPNVTIDMTMPPLMTNQVIGADFGAWKNVSVSSAKLGNYITDVSLNTYMRSIPVQFVATGMMPNTKLYSFFDGKEVTANCRPLDVKSKYGDLVFTDANGVCNGEFMIPANTFFTGQKTFKLTNIKSNSDDPDMLLTSAEGIFWAGGLDYDKQERLLNIITPIVVPPPPPTTTSAPVVTTQKATTSAPVVTAGTTRPPIVNPPVTQKPPATTGTTRPPATTGTTRPPATTGTTRPPATTGTTRPPTTAATTKAPTTPPPTTKAPCTKCYNNLVVFCREYNIPCQVDVAHSDPLWIAYNNDKAGNNAKWSAAYANGEPGLPQGLLNQYGKSGCAKWCNDSADHDPIAQSFLIDDSCFITGVDVYFQVAAKNDILWVDLREMINGYPGPTVLATKKMPAASVIVSDDSSKPMHVEFPYPTYVEGGKEYCIVVGGKDPSSRVWICKLGDKDILTGKLVDTQPNTGSFFKSQNNTTWDASQYEDMKFKLYRARFKHNTAKFVLVNKPLKDEEYVSNPFETEVGSRSIRVWNSGHAMLPGDKFKPFIGQHTWLNIKQTAGTISVGHIIISDTGSAKVSDISVIDDGTVNVLLVEINGYLLDGQTFKAEPIKLVVNDTHVVEVLTGGIPSTGEDTGCTGIINYDFNMAFNGIPLIELNKELTVKSVDSVNSFIIETTTPATVTGRTGGEAIVNANKRYDVFNISGSYTNYGSTGTWGLVGTGHSSNGLFEQENYTQLEQMPIELQTDYHLDKPYKFANQLNETRMMTGSKSQSIIGDFVTPNTLLSPVININTFSFVGVFNNIDWNEEDTYNVAPNGTNRLVAETDPQEGSTIYKYISRDIILKDPARDIRILVDVHKPKHSDFDLWIKTRAPWDVTDIDLIPWVRVEGVWKDFTCVELSEYREVEVTLGEVMPSIFGTNEFTICKLKITGRSKNPAQPVLFKMLRAIAVT